MASEACSTPQTRFPGAGIMEADDRQVTTFSQSNRHSTIGLHDTGPCFSNLHSKKPHSANKSETRFLSPTGIFVLFHSCLTSQLHALCTQGTGLPLPKRAATLRLCCSKLPSQPVSIWTPGKPVLAMTPITPGTWQGRHRSTGL